MVGRRAGSVRCGGRELIGCASNEIARAGIALCPEERGIFASLSVEENLLLPPIVQRFAEKFPQVRFKRLQGNPPQIAGMLASGQADLGMATETLSETPGPCSRPSGP